MLMVYNYDPDEHKSELFSSYSCGNEILTLDWSHSENAPNSGLVVYGTQEGTLGVFNSLSNTLLHETTVEGVSAVVDVAFSPVMTSYCSALASGPSPLRFWDLASGAMALDGAGVGAGVRVNCVQYIPNGAGLFCGCGDGHVRLFDIRGGKSVSDEKVCDGEVSGLKLAVSVPAAGSATLFACGTDGIVREFDYRNLSKISLIFGRWCLTAGCVRIRSAQGGDDDGDPQGDDRLLFLASAGSGGEPPGRRVAVHAGPEQGVQRWAVGPAVGMPGPVSGRERDCRGNDGLQSGAGELWRSVACLLQTGVYR